MGKLEGKVAVITGGSSGMALASAKRGAGSATSLGYNKNPFVRSPRRRTILTTS